MSRGTPSPNFGDHPARIARHGSRWCCGHEVTWDVKQYPVKAGDRQGLCRYFMVDDFVTHAHVSRSKGCLWSLPAWRIPGDNPLLVVASKESPTIMISVSVSASVTGCLNPITRASTEPPAQNGWLLVRSVFMKLCLGRVNNNSLKRDVSKRDVGRLNRRFQITGRRPGHHDQDM